MECWVCLLGLLAAFAIGALHKDFIFFPTSGDPGNNMCLKCGCKSGLWVLHEIVNKTYAESMKKKSWMPFGSYLLNSTANPAHFHSNWAELAVLFSR